MHRTEPAATGPSRSNRWSSRYWLVGALAAGLALGSPAAAEEPPPAPPEPASEPTANALADAPTEPSSGEIAESAWDVPGQLLIDARDELSDAETEGLAAAFGLRVAPTDLFAETYRSYGLATVRYPVLEVTAQVEPFENRRGWTLRALRAGKPRTMSGRTSIPE